VQQRKKLLADSLGKSGVVVDVTKEYNIKHVIAAPTFLATAECICDEKFSPPVLSQYMLQVTKIITYLCSMELLVTCQSVGAFQVDLSLVDGATAATSFELEVKVSMQMYWSWNPGVWSIISGRVKKLIAQGENETRCKASRLESSLHDSASDLAFVCVSWQYQIDPRDSFFQEKDGSQESTRSRVGMLLPPTVQVI
jgi:hypothetical protein